MKQDKPLSEEQIKTLIRAALRARKKAYAPYSHYQVGAALLSAGGEIFPGCNVENASFGATICAERAAFVSAIAQGKKRFAAIAIVAGPDDADARALASLNYPTPCGICRQFMREFTDPDRFQIILARSAGDYVVCSLDDLLPASFGPESL